MLPLAWSCCGALLAWRAVGVRTGAVTRLRHVGYAAVALALPYACCPGRWRWRAGRGGRPSLLQAIVAAFLLAWCGRPGRRPRLAPWSGLCC